MEFELEHVALHGQDVGFRRGGSGPVVVLLHGMAGSATTWRHLLPALSEDYTVVAPDLMGHGSSGKPKGDYSLGAFAAGLRDLLVTLGYERVTLVGQSFGGGVALQFAYQHPERCARLALVSSGGLGPEVNPLLRVLAVPGTGYVLSLACNSWLHRSGIALGGTLGRLGWRPGAQLEEVWRSYGSLADAETRTAFLQTLRSVVDSGGQRISAQDKLHLAAAVPTLIVWGDRDPIIPVGQAYAAHEAIAGSRLEIFEGCGHFPHCEAPERFLDVLRAFMRETPAAQLPGADPAALLRAAGG